MDMCQLYNLDPIDRCVDRYCKENDIPDEHRSLLRATAALVLDDTFEDFLSKFVAMEREEQTTPWAFMESFEKYLWDFLNIYWKFPDDICT